MVFPPIYDTAPLNIPVLQPGESVVIEVPWYPPNVNNYNCTGQAGHFCLLARIETTTSAPFGMTFAEGLNVGTNTRNNNNIAWKNVTIVDDVLDPLALRLMTGTMIRNIFDREAIFEIALQDRTEERRFLLAQLVPVWLSMPDEVLKRIGDRDARLQDLAVVKDEVSGRLLLRIVGKEPRFSVPMKPSETFTAELIIDLPEKEIPGELLSEQFHFDIEQRIDLPEEYFGVNRREAIDVGGVRFTVDFAQIAKSREAGGDRIQVADLQLKLSPAGRQAFDIESADDGDFSPMQHLSVGEPLSVEVSLEEGDLPMRVLSLELDGNEVAAAEGTDTLRQTMRFDAPGVHTIVTRGINENGEVMLRRTRVLVSETIPPNAIIVSPSSGSEFKLGDEVEIAVDTSAAFEREVREVSLYVKEGDTIFTGLNLVMSENYAPVATAEGPGPHRFAYTPERVGIYMFQVGVTDNEGTSGVSGHAMVRVTE